MYHDTALAAPAKADPRPRSAVSGAVGLVGMAGMITWVVIARTFGMDGPFSALTNVLACALPMVLWSVFVDKVHRRPSTGIDWSIRRPWRETFDISLTKLAGLWLTWGGIGVIYATGRFYWQGNFAFAMWCFEMAAPWLFVLSIPYVLWLDRRLIEPKDGCWSLGAWLMGHGEDVDRSAIANHLRSWAVKGFFLAFMLSIVPPNFGDFIRWETGTILSHPVSLANWLISFMFVVDVAFATAGYILTFRPLDSHIRSANPFASGWAAALICYPPFILMGNGGPLDYHSGTYGQDGWFRWFGESMPAMWAFGAVLVALTAVYAWATVAFGFRFSNLTNRGILTNGPYAFTRHPAYLSKNLFWWVATLPFLATTGSLADAARNTLLMCAVSGVYYWRAKTEEKHLKLDPDYVAYDGWIARNGAVPLFFAWLTGKKAGAGAEGSPQT
ncbi:methyltransferase family protein [Stakelama tenebrarum]|nr:isoprenylcysteine carboxylmethyltransferase family protein [Sphingosinithalassobacter tenebrarum]